MKVKRNKALAVEMARVKQGHDRLNNFDGDCGRGNGQSSCELPGASWDLNMKNQESADQNHLTSSSSSAILQQRNWWSRQTIRCQNLVIGVSGMVVAIALVALLVDKFGHQAQRQSSPDSETPTLHPELLTPRSPLHASGQVQKSQTFGFGFSTDCFDRCLILIHYAVSGDRAMHSCSCRAQYGICPSLPSGNWRF
eukprot:SAG31_NODE_419_length_15872_cov_21.857985_2_plen_196_part_00